MGKTTNLLLDAGAAALGCRPAAVASLPPLRAVKELHRTAADELGVDAGARDEVEALLLQ
jgi:aspartate kinase